MPKCTGITKAMDLETAPGDFISTSVCPMEYPLAAPRGLGQGHHRPDRGPEKLVLDKGEREKVFFWR
jgi:hypothetical protein